MPSPKRLLDALVAPGDTGLSRDAAHALSEKIVKLSKADAIDSGLNTVDAAADMPIRRLPFKMTREQRANFARVFPHLQLN